MHQRLNKKRLGFTIIELLVVIVVIGILVAISVISYTGINQKATIASLQSDLSNASTKLKAYQVIYGSYPTLDSNNCPAVPEIDDNYCLKFSPGNSIADEPFAGYVVNNDTNPQTFSLTLSSNDIHGVVTENSQPSLLISAPLSPVADWIATPQGDHYGNYYDTISKSWATVTRATPKTIYDPVTQHIYDVPSNYLAINPWSTYQSGGNGSAAVIEEARTNYLINSYGASNTGGAWSSGWSHTFPFCLGTPVWSITKGVYSETAQHIQYTGVSGDTAGQAQFAAPVVTGVFTAGENATGSFYIKGTASAGVTAYLYVQALSDTTYIATSSSLAILDGQWHRVVVPYTNLPTGTTKISTRLQVNGITEGRSLDLTVDAYQIEKGSFATSYIPTNTTPVTRNADIVTVPTTRWDSTEGTFIAMTYYKSLNAGSQTQYLLTWKPNTTNGIEAYLRNDLAAAYLTTRKDGVTLYDVKTGLSSGAFAYGGRWSLGQTVRAFYNGAYSITRNDIYALPTGTFPDVASVGAGKLHAPLHRLITYGTALTDAQIESLNPLVDGP